MLGMVDNEVFDHKQLEGLARKIGKAQRRRAGRFHEERDEAMTPFLTARLWFDQ